MAAGTMSARADKIRAELSRLRDLIEEQEQELDYLDCPGFGFCHGCAAWCPNCGDVDTMCDAHDCDAHHYVHNEHADGCAQDEHNIYHTCDQPSGCC